MTYTTQGLMTPMDLQDNLELHDMHPHPHCPGHANSAGYGPLERCSAAADCPAARETGGPMGTYERMTMYFAQSASGRMTARQRRRLVKKAGRDPEYQIIRDNGMGYPRAMQGYKELSLNTPVPVSGAPY